MAWLCWYFTSSARLYIDTMSVHLIKNFSAMGLREASHAQDLLHWLVNQPRVLPNFTCLAEAITLIGRHRWQRRAYRNRLAAGMAESGLDQASADTLALTSGAYEEHCHMTVLLEFDQARKPSLDLAHQHEVVTLQSLCKGVHARHFGECRDGLRRQKWRYRMHERSHAQSIGLIEFMAIEGAYLHADGPCGQAVS